MELTHHGDLAVLRADAPGPFTAALVFRAGVRFATFRTVAVPHLVEHLVMAALPRTHLEMNAQVDDHAMVFHASGDREEVLGFLRAVADQLHHLELHRLEHEAKVIEIEAGMPVTPATAEVVVHRYGFVGVGLAGVGGPAASQATAAQVTEFVRNHLVAENAVLVVTGPLPDGFTLSLPRGRRPQMPVPEVDQFTGPSLVRSGEDAVSLSFELPLPGPAEAVVGYLLGTAVEEELRHRQGVVYEVDLDRILVTPQRCLGIIACSGRPEALQAIATCLVGELRRLAVDGPSDAELGTARRALSGMAADPRQHFEAALGEALRVLEHEVGPRRIDEYVAQLEGVDAAQVRQSLAGSLHRMLVIVPAGADVEVDGLRDCTDDEWDDGPEITGRVFGRRLVSLAPLDARACVGDTGISLTLAGKRLALHWTRVVGVEQDGRDRIIVGADGRTLPVPGGWFKASDDLVALIDHHGAGLTFVSPSDVGDPQG